MTHPVSNKALDTNSSVTHTRTMMTLTITGAIDRCDPDPAAPSNLYSRHIGQLTASWLGDMPQQRAAAILKVSTGRGTGDLAWGSDVLQLRWLGDPPPPEIAQAVYDLVLNGGPGRREIRVVVEAQPVTEYQPSYHIARVGRA